MKLFLNISLIITGLMITNSGVGQNSLYSKFNNRYFKMADNVGPDDYMHHNAIFKIKKEYRNFCNGDNINIPKLNQYLDKIGSKDLHRKFPRAVNPGDKMDRHGNKFVDLTRTYEFTFANNNDLVTVLNELISLGYVEYAEPHYIPKLFYTPNDPSTGSQYHLSAVKAYQGWDIQKGDTNVVIGIIDTGIDTDHPDLVGNIKYNADDPADGIDNDNDGFVDNYRGWDVAMNDNDPQVPASEDHGCHVSGCAAAHTDNGIGVAGPGFNCKILPVKIADQSGTLTSGNEGIIYAADLATLKGWKLVLNMSYGGPGGGSTGQDVMNYAAINNDVLLFAAAGNDGNEIESYPAAFDNVLAVASVGNGDSKAFSSTYGYWVDICAPGDQVYATINNGNYFAYSGTSMASPVAAGVGAIIRSQYPFLSGLQAGQQVKVTTDDIYSVGSNGLYQDKMGTGRVNMYQGLGGLTSPSVVLKDLDVMDGNDEAFVIGDTLTIEGNFFNYLIATGNCTATLTTTSSDVTIINNTSNLGIINLNDSVVNSSDPFKVKINSGTPINAKPLFKIDLTDGNYSTSFYFDFTVNVDYVNIAVNDVATSITSKGILGFNDFSTQEEGLGFRYIGGGAGSGLNGENLLFDGGLMIGVPGKVMDHVRGDGANVDTDFGSSSNAKKAVPSVVSEIDVHGKFNDDPAGGNKIGLSVRHEAYAWNDPGHTKYVQVIYTISNTSGTTLNDLYTGIFCDWDIAMGDPQGYADNRCGTDATRQLGYIWNDNPALNGFYAGVRLLSSPAPFIHYAVDHVIGGGGGADLSDGYSTAEKYTTLSTNRATAGYAGGANGNDVFSVVSTGPFAIAAGDSVTVSFAIVAGDDLADLQEASDSSYVQSGGSTVGVNDIKSDIFHQAYPNPANGELNVNLNLMTSQNVRLTLLNALGQQIKQIENRRLNDGIHNYTIDVSEMKPGIYYYKLQAGTSIYVKKISIAH